MMRCLGGAAVTFLVLVRVTLAVSSEVSSSPNSNEELLPPPPNTGKDTEETVHGWGTADWGTAGSYKRKLRDTEGGSGPAEKMVSMPVVKTEGQGQLPFAEENGTRSSWMESERDYLNGLTASSVAHTDQQLSNIVFIKTHKTASTTLAAILYRYAARHKLKLAHFGQGTSVHLEEAALQTEKSGELVDIFHYHITPKGQLQGDWFETKKNYRKIMRFPDSINFVTVLREPRSHLLSYYYYYLQPRNQLSIEEFLGKVSGPGEYNHMLLDNPLSAEFGVRTEKQLQDFISKAIPQLQLIMLTERLDEGLMLLRHLLNWRMIDITYMTLNKTVKGRRRWDGKPFVDRPEFEDLPKEVQDKIDDLTALDRILYDAGKEEFEKRLASVSDGMEENLATFAELQTIVKSYLDANASSLANPMYRQMDVYNKPPPLNPF